MTQTTNYNLNKFETTDKMNPTTLEGLNDNADIIDGALNTISTSVSGKESTTNKVTSISSSSTDTQYPSAKLLYDQLQLKTNHDNVAKDFWYGTQAEYDALATKDTNTIYMTDENSATPIATTIDENSTNSEIASAKAVYDKINDLNYISCGISSLLSISMPTAWIPVKIPVDVINYQSGDGFTLSNGNIVVGSKPKVVEIYIYAKPQQMNTTLTYGITALLNGTSLGVVETIPYRADSIPFQRLYIANVKEGDIIQLACRGGSANMTFTVGASAATILIKSLSEVAS